MEHFSFIKGCRVSAIAVLCALAASPSSATADVNVWFSQSDFHHRRTGVPDQDQKRVGLPNQGSCYCVPTSCLNMILYIANHGYAGVDPGPGNYAGYDTYYDLTAILNEWGTPAEMNVSPGGDDPNDPDCPGRGDGGDGECDQLGCGTSYTQAYDTLVDWLGPQADDFTFTATFLGDMLTPSTESLGILGYFGSTMVMAYGRYTVVGGDGDGVPILRRGGGHSVTVNEVFVDGSFKRIFVRDPGQDDGDIFGPSPYATKEYTITDHYVAITSDTPGGPLLNWTYKNLDGLDEPHSDGRRRFLDGYLAIKPKQGWTWNNNFLLNIPLTIGFDIDPIPSMQLPIAGGNILAACLDHLKAGHFVAVEGTEVTPAQIMHVSHGDGSVMPLRLLTSLTPHMALGRLGDLFITDGTSLLRYDAESLDRIMTISVIHWGDPHELVLNNEDDTVHVIFGFSAGGGQIAIFPHDFDQMTTPTLLSFPPGTQLNGISAALHPATGNLWIASTAAGGAVEFEYDLAANEMTLVQRIDIADARGISFDDGGRMYIAADGECVAYQQDRFGNWVVDRVVSEECGPSIELERSTTNFERGIHDTELWDNIDPEDLFDIGEVIFDCFGDVNRDGTVNLFDLLDLLALWGPCPTDDACGADLDFSKSVNLLDLLDLLAHWGACPEV